MHYLFKNIPYCTIYSKHCTGKFPFKLCTTNYGAYLLINLAFNCVELKSCFYGLLIHTSNVHLKRFFIFNQLTFNRLNEQKCKQNKYFRQNINFISVGLQVVRLFYPSDYFIYSKKINDIIV